MKPITTLFLVSLFLSTIACYDFVQYYVSSASQYQSITQLFSSTTHSLMIPPFENVTVCSVIDAIDSTVKEKTISLLHDCDCLEENASITLSRVEFGFYYYLIYCKLLKKNKPFFQFQNQVTFLESTTTTTTTTIPCTPFEWEIDATKEGFHQILTTSTTTISHHPWFLLLPRDVFVDPYEVQEHLANSFVDLEKSVTFSYPILLQVNSQKMETPIHFRYQRPLENQTHQQVYLLPNLYDSSTNQWLPICNSNILSFQIPVGQLQHYELVTYTTIGVTIFMVFVFSFFVIFYS